MADKPKMFGGGGSKGKKKHDRRPSSFRRGYDRVWRRLRDSHKTENPLCLHCIQKGFVTVAREIDHIIPFDGLNDPLRLDPSNLQSLCRSCHAIKTHKDKG